jgi:predicted nucleic acid-binding protein
MMLLYLDASCLNRPFDDQAQPRVRQEAEAVLRILKRVCAGHDGLVWSSALTVELGAHPEPDIRAELLSWAGRSRRSMTTDTAVRLRVEQLVGFGLKPLDAAHVAYAESARSDALLTCDDRFLRQARRARLPLRVMSPIEYMEELSDV